MPSSFARHWELDPDTTYLNHGSFGPSPVPVRQARDEWSARLERQPMRFYCQEMESLLEEATDQLAGFLQTKAGRLALIDNSTMAMNVVAESVTLNPGDEVVLTDHEYGAVKNIWHQKCRESQARLLTVELPLSMDAAAIENALDDVCTSRTRMIVVSHVTSQTALILPVELICQFAKSRNILTAIDGPHAVAMLDLHLDKMGCDFYCASCHKWLCAPFGSGFLWVHPRHHGAVRCPVISWGGSIAGQSASWKDRINWLGTRDPAPLLSIPAAISFMADVGFDVYRNHAQELISQARTRLLEIDGIVNFADGDLADFVSMSALKLPTPKDWQPGYHGKCDLLQQELRDEHNIEIPVFSWNDHRLMRLSAHLYNSPEDFERLANCIKASKNFR